MFKGHFILVFFVFFLLLELSRGRLLERLHDLSDNIIYFGFHSEIIQGLKCLSVVQFVLCPSISNNISCLLAISSQRSCNNVFWQQIPSPAPDMPLHPINYYNFQISPRTLCTISTDCFAETPVTVSFDHILCTF